MKPKARHNKLLVQAVADELVVYDQGHERAHSLNRTAALVWRTCDGKTSVAQMAALLHRELGSPADENLVWLALDQLEREHLLEQPVTRPVALANASRRDLLKKVGRTAAIALMLPAVTSIVAPKPAMAQSPALPGGTCNCSAIASAPAVPCTVGATQTTTKGDGDCMGTNPKCVGKCTKTANWECVAAGGGTTTWLGTGQSHDCPRQ